MKTDKKELGVLALLLALVALFFARFLTGEEILGFKDLSRYFYPLRYLMAEQVRAGILPLWNPYIFCGYPLMASLQVGFFYPLTVIHYLLPFNLAFNYYTIIHYFLAACFMYLLLKHWRLSRAAAMLGGLVFAFSGYLLSVSNMSSSLASVVWLPLIVLVFDRIITNVGTGLVPVRVNGQPQGLSLHIIALAVLLALMFLGGEPTIIYVTVWLLAAYAAAFAGSVKRSLAALGWLALAGLIALGLVAVQLLPFLELAALSDRVGQTAYDLLTLRSLPPRELINLILPYFYGNPAQFGGFTHLLIGQDFQDWLLSPYMGILPLVLVFCSFFRKDRKTAFFALAALAGFLLAFGKYLPVYRYIYLLPGVSLIRYPVKYLFLVNFSLVVLSAFGFDRLLRSLSGDRLELGRTFRWLTAFSLALLAPALAAFFYRGRIFSLLAGRYPAKLPAYFFQLLEEMVIFNISTALFAAMSLLGFAALLYCGRRGLVKERVFAFLTIAIILSDLFANSSSIAVPVSAAVFAAVPANYSLMGDEGEPARFFYSPELDRQNQTVTGDDYDDALLEAKDNLSANWHLPYRRADFFGYESVLPRDFAEHYYQELGRDKLAAGLGWLSRANVKYLALNAPLKDRRLRLLRHKDRFKKHLYLYENREALPRAYVIYDDRPGRFVWKKAALERYSAREVVILAELDRPGRLFLGDRYYPGWRAYVNGRAAPIIKSRKFFREVDLPAGRHRVRFSYEPGSFKLGAVISLLTMMGLAFQLWRLKR